MRQHGFQIGRCAGAASSSSPPAKLEARWQNHPAAAPARDKRSVWCRIDKIINIKPSANL
jgi:hypothetical protein